MPATTRWQPGACWNLTWAKAALPLLFFRGGYGRFMPASMVADVSQGITLAQLRDVDHARGEMERLAERIGGLCIMTAWAGDALVIAASAGQPRQGGTATLVGQHLPFASPAAAVFGAWLPPAEQAAWTARANSPGGQGPSLAAVRRRGFSVGMRADAQRALSERLQASARDRRHHADIQDLFAALVYDPDELTAASKRDIRLISAPVFDSDGTVKLAITLYEFPRPDGEQGIDRYIDEVAATAAAVTARGGGHPAPLA